MFFFTESLPPGFFPFSLTCGIVVVGFQASYGTNLREMVRRRVQENKRDP